MRTDQDVKRDVEAELRWDPRFNENDIAVSVKSGTVTLSGFAYGYADRESAEEAAKRVAGVAAVANDVEVRLPDRDERADPDIARDVVAAIRGWLPTVGERVRPVVSRGCVRLEGEVDWNFEREAAALGARHVPGVRSVANEIQIRFCATPAEVRESISAAFRRSASIEAHKIMVEGSAGEIVLRGNVRSWAERQEADRAAWSAPGVRKVDNRITVSA